MTEEPQGIQLTFRPEKAVVDLVMIDQCKVAAPTRGFIGSVAKLGVLTPIILQKNGGDKYAIIAGRRRVSAAIEAGQEKIDALIVDELSAEQGALIALTENMQRQPNPLVEARLMKVLVDGGRDQKAIATELNVSQPQVAQMLKLLKLCDEVQTRVEEGEITISVARKMANLDHETQRELLNLMDERGTKLAEKDVSNAKREGKLEDVVPDLPDPVNQVDLAKDTLQNFQETFSRMDKKAQTELRKAVAELYKTIGGKLPAPAKKSVTKKAKK